MKRLLFALMAAPALAGGIGTAPAGDVAPYYRAPPVLVPYDNWNGFYIGANVGGAGSNNDALWSPLPSLPVFGIFPIAGNTAGSSANRRLSGRL
jgi:outer membrane immunogenic protein